MKKLKKSYYDKENDLRWFMTLEEQKNFYKENLERVIKNPRYYLDHLEELDVYLVSFINYQSSDKKSLKSTKLYK